MMIDEILPAKDELVLLDWDSFDSDISVIDKIFIFERYYSNINLRESNDEDKRDFFISLIDLSDKPVLNQK